MAAERHFRAFARRALSLPATLTSGTAEPATAKLVNLGLGGASVETAAPLSVGASVLLEVAAPNLWDPLVVPAHVAWTSEPASGVTRAGLAFQHAERTALPALVELLAAQLYE
jgi:Tfp pilus assembly protein PilZ